MELGAQARISRVISEKDSTSTAATRRVGWRGY